MHTLAKLALTLLPCLLVQSNASCITLLQDDFNTASVLNGDTPDISASGNIWVGNSRFESNGAVLYSSGSSSNGMISVDIGESYFATNLGVYSMSASITFAANASPGTQIFGFGFNAATTTASGSIQATPATQGTPWILLRENGQLEVRSNATSLAYQSAIGAYSNGSTYLLTLQLDTSTPLWTVDAFVGATQLDLDSSSASMSYSYSLPNPTGIRYATISTTSTLGQNGYMDNVSLNFTPVPEPSSLAIIGWGVLALLGRRRKAVRIDHAS